MKKDDRERALREESERAYQKWLKETGRTEELARKKKERRFEMKKIVLVNWKTPTLFAVFAVVLVATIVSFSLVPGSSSISSWITHGVPLVIAWFATVAIARGVSTKRALGIATICLIVAAPIVLSTHITPTPTPTPTTTTTPPPTTTTLTTTTQTGTTTTTPSTTTTAQTGTTTTTTPTETTTTTTTPPENTENVPPWSDNTPPENVPEDMVAFRFVSSFTYWGGEVNLDVTEVDLPWPHIGEQIEVGAPDNKIVLVEGWSRPGTLTTYPWELGSNSLSQLIWLRMGIDKGEDVEFENIFENGFWSSSGARYLNLRSLSGPGLGNENFMQKANLQMSLHPGETVSIHGIFLVNKENAESVRIGDLATEGLEWSPEENRWHRPLVPKERKAPLILAWPANEDVKNVEVLIQLDKFENGTWITIEKFYEMFESYLVNITFIDNAL